MFHGVCVHVHVCTCECMCYPQKNCAPPLREGLCQHGAHPLHLPGCSEGATSCRHRTTKIKTAWPLSESVTKYKWQFLTR